MAKDILDDIKAVFMSSSYLNKQKALFAPLNTKMLAESSVINHVVKLIEY